MNQSKALLLIFVKHPKAGQVKTRLAAGIGQAKALKAYYRLLEYTKNLAQKLEVDKAVFYGNTVPVSDLWRQANFLRYLQEGDSLGARMAKAFKWGFENDYQRIIIIGSDCAQINEDILNEAYEKLSKYDFVIGPAKDGGYYLLGMNHLYTEVFEDKNWSTETVCKDTISDLEQAEKSYYLLPTLSDIDTIDDLAGTFLEDLLP